LSLSTQPTLDEASAKDVVEAADEKPISIAFGVEGNSGMRHRGELADLVAFIAVADQLSFRPAALLLGVTPSASPREAFLNSPQ
jgi:hypothetical protein